MERTTKRSPWPTDIGMRARRRASRLPIGAPTRAGAGSGWDDLRRTHRRRRDRRSCSDACALHCMGARLRPLRRLHKNVGISVPLETQELAMSLLIVYVALVIAGDFVAYFVGLLIEPNVPIACRPFWRCIFCSSGARGR